MSITVPSLVTSKTSLQHSKPNGEPSQTIAWSNALKIIDRKAVFSVFTSIHMGYLKKTLDNMETKRNIYSNMETMFSHVYATLLFQVL